MVIARCPVEGHYPLMYAWEKKVIPQNLGWVQLLGVTQKETLSERSPRIQILSVNMNNNVDGITTPLKKSRKMKSMIR